MHMLCAEMCPNKARAVNTNFVLILINNILYVINLFFHMATRTPHKFDAIKPMHEADISAISAGS